MSKKESINKVRKRIRSKIKGTSECPRLAVFRSNSHIYAQIIDDVTGNTLVSCSTLDKEVKDENFKDEIKVKFDEYFEFEEDEEDED